MADPIDPLNSVFKRLTGTQGSRVKITDLPEVKRYQTKQAINPILEAVLTVGTAPLSLAATLAQIGITYSPEAEAVIRPGGNPALNLWQNMSRDLGKVLGTLKRGSITNPSVGIGYNDIYGFKHSPTLVFNPTSPLLDPQMAKANRLYNRDVYTATDKQPFGQDMRFSKKDLRFEQGYPTDISQILSGLASPEFSFKTYEQTPYGARLLGNKENQETYIRAADKAIWEYFQAHPQYANMSREAKAKWIQYQALEKKDPDALEAYELSRMIPSDYAELKVLGEVPLQSRDVSALIIPPSFSRSDPLSVALFGDELAPIKAEAERLGIRAGTPQQLAPQELTQKYSNLAEGITNTIQRRVENPTFFGTIYDLLPDFVQNRIHPDWVDRAVDDVSSGIEAYKYIEQGLWKHPAAAADVASTLTSQDSDAVMNLLNTGR